MKTYGWLWVSSRDTVTSTTIYWRQRCYGQWAMSWLSSGWEDRERLEHVYTQMCSATNEARKKIDSGCTPKVFFCYWSMSICQSFLMMCRCGLRLSTFAYIHSNLYYNFLNYTVQEKLTPAISVYVLMCLCSCLVSFKKPYKWYAYYVWVCCGLQ